MTGPWRPGPAACRTRREPRAEPDYAALYRELKRKGITLRLLWHEYK